MRAGDGRKWKTAGYFAFYDGKDSCFVERAHTFPATPGMFPGQALEPDSRLAKMGLQSHIAMAPGTSGSCLSCINKNVKIEKHYFVLKWHYRIQITTSDFVFCVEFEAECKEVHRKSRNRKVGGRRSCL